jgi:hypothetical protein
VFTYTHPCYSSPCYLFEINAFFRLTRRIVREAHQRGIDQIHIYDLAEYFKKKGAAEGAETAPEQG